MINICYKELKEKINYNPDTGVFTRIKPGRGINLKKPAGCVKTKETGKRYISIRYDGMELKAHRLAWFFMTGSWPENEIDHINGDGTDNRWINLRDVTRIENGKNLRRSSSNTSGITGVYFSSKRNRWKSQIYVNSKLIQIGYYNNIFDTACARKNAEKLYGFHKNHGSDRPL